MKFSTREDVEVPIEAVFQALADFESFERRALRRGAEVERTDGLTEPGVGMAWTVGFKFRGRDRTLLPRVTRYDVPNLMEVISTSGGLDVVLAVELVDLSPARTRMSVGLEMKPNTLSARLLVQSMKLAKANLTKRFKVAVADYAETIERDYRGVVVG
ncbi:MAG: SRPBCC family protein [Pseudomonadota bacterium]